MDDRAFHNDPAIKAQALDNLRRHVAAGTFVYYPAWEDGNANVIGAIVEADDTPLYAERLGYPIALAETLPVFVNGFRPRDEAARFAEAWLKRTPVGADLTTIVSQLILALIDEPGLAELTGRHPDVEQCRQTVIELHRRAVAGDNSDRKAWKTVRMAAVAATDRISDAPLERQAAGVVEAAAWPGTMRTVLRDTINGFGSLELRQRMAEMNWTDEEESSVFRIRDQAEKTGFKAEFSGIERVLAILDADHPALAERFRMRNDRMEMSGMHYRSFGWKAVEMMERAPLVTAPVPAL